MKIVTCLQDGITFVVFYILKEYEINFFMKRLHTHLDRDGKYKSTSNVTGG